MLLKNLKHYFCPRSYNVGQFVSRYRKLPRVSISILRIAQRSILRSRISARLNVAVPPLKETRVGPKHEKITLPYSSELTARSFTRAIRTLQLCKPNNFCQHLIELKATTHLRIRASSIAFGFTASFEIHRPKYSNYCTFSKLTLLHFTFPCILINIHFVFRSLIFKSLSLQKVTKASRIV